jgi:DHA1 family bicyclomycin/chloramphenicol resistance-like MFS transporter
VVAALIAPAVWGSTLSLAGAMAGFLILGGVTALLYRRSVLLPR